MQANIQAVRRAQDVHISSFDVVLESDSEDEQDEPTTGCGRIRRKIWLTMENSSYSKLAMVLSIFILILIAWSVLNFLIETFPAYQEEPPIAFFIMEAFIVTCFTLEYGLRYWSCPMKFPKGKFIIAPLNVIDVLAILPFYIELVLQGGFSGLSVLRVIRLTRVFRLFKFGRYAKSLRIMVKSLRQSTEGLLLLVFFLVLGVILFASCEYFAELFGCTWDEDTTAWIYKSQWDEENSETPFQSIPHTMWWAIVTMTTVGYGDMFPITPYGKFAAAITMLGGIIIIAFPVAIISDKFTELYQEENRAIIIAREQKQKAKEHEMRSPLLANAELITDQLDDLINKKATELLGDVSSALEDIEESFLLFQKNAFPRIREKVILPYRNVE